MILALETPSARAAMMYSKLRPRRNSARTRPTSDTHENNSRIPSGTKKPGTGTEDRIRSRYSDGIALKQNLYEAFRRPKIDPAAEIALHTAKAATPMIEEMMVSESPNSAEMREAVDQPRHHVAALVVGYRASCIQRSRQPVRPFFCTTSLHCASVSIQVGFDGAGVGRSRLWVW